MEEPGRPNANPTRILFSLKGIKMITNKALLDTTPFWLRIWAERLRVAVEVQENITDNPDIIEIYQKDGETSYYAEDDYAKLCQKVWNQYSTWDCGSSSAFHNNLEWLSRFIKDAYKESEDSKRLIKERELQTLQERVAQLKKELEGKG